MHVRPHRCGAMRIVGEKYYTSFILVVAFIVTVLSKKRDQDSNLQDSELEPIVDKGPDPPGPIPGFNVTSIGSYVGGQRLDPNQGM